MVPAQTQQVLNNTTTIEVMQEVTDALVKLNFHGQGQCGQTLERYVPAAVVSREDSINPLIPSIEAVKIQKFVSNRSP